MRDSESRRTAADELPTVQSNLTKSLFPCLAHEARKWLRMLLSVADNHSK